MGDADYAAMDALDGDKVRLRNRAGVIASRDIVQFVPMRNFKKRSSHALAKEVRESYGWPTSSVMARRMGRKGRSNARGEGGGGAGGLRARRSLRS